MRSLPTAAAPGLPTILPDQPAGSLALAAAVAASAMPADMRDGALLDVVTVYFIAEERRRANVAASDASFERQNAIDAGATVSDIERYEAAAGIALFHAQADIIEAQQDEALISIATMPATTRGGLQAKARVALDGIADDDAAEKVTAKRIPELLANRGDLTVYSCRNLALLLSIAVDAARLDFLPRVRDIG